MKPLRTIHPLLLVLSIGIFSCSSSKYAQSGTSEHDDLYFNKSDRYPVIATDGTVTAVQRSEEDAGVGVGYNSKTLNPDYGLPQDAQTEASGYADDEYYVENHDDAYIEQAVEDYLRNNSSTAQRYNSPRYQNNFDDVFWSDPLYYQGTIFDPLYRSYYGVYSPFASRSYYRPYSSFYRPWGPRLSVSIGFGFGFGSYYGPYYDPFYYGGGFGYGYGYGYGGYGGGYYGGYNNIAWCPPSYYGGVNNSVVINNIENSNPGNVRYATRASRGPGYIASSNGIRQRTVDAGTESRTVRSAANRTVRSASERTINNGKIIQNDGSRTAIPTRTRSVNSYDQADRSNSRFRTHSLNSTKDGSNLNGRTRSNSSLQQRGSTVNRDTYRTPSRDVRTRRSTNRSGNYSTSPSRNSGSSYQNRRPTRSPASSGVRSNTRTRSSSSYSRTRSMPSRSRTPSRVGSSNYGRSSSSGRVSSPSRSSSSGRISSPSRSSSSGGLRSSSPNPSRRSIPARSSGGGTRSITR